jgi:hypothetical protein
MQSTFIHQCPECSHLLSFSSDQTNIIICQSCQSTINRNSDGGLQNKPQFPILNKVEIIQPGTTGVWEKQAFTVLGRFRAWFEESVFNYWTLQFSNGEIAWLGEGYGIYSIVKASANSPISAAELARIDIGDIQDMGSPEKYILEKKYKTIKWEVEGELYIPNNTASSFRVMEFSNAHGNNYCFFDFEDHKVAAFEVTYVSFGSLELKNLRAYSNEGKKFNCSSCRSQIHVKTYPYAQSCACSSCGMQYSLKEGMDFKKGNQANTNEYIYIPIGTSGEIHGIKYEVIGYAQKEEQNSYHSKWREYTLFNETEGFAFLSEYDGHWIYIRENCNSPVLLNQNEKSFFLDNEQFQLFNSYKYEVINAKGEFPYDIYDNQNTRVREFISPPQVWVQERDNKEGITWYLGKHITARELKDGFKVTGLPYRTGIGAVQPTGHVSLSKMIGATIAGMLILLFLHTFIGVAKQERPLLSQMFSFPDTSDQVSFVTEKYILDKWRSNIRFAIEAPVSNSWFELAATLVNAETGKEYNISQGVEYYYGYTGGESWTEGSKKENAYLTKIPAGTYFLQLQGTRENKSDKIQNFYLDITYDVITHRNIWWAVFLLLIWPVGKYALVHYAEKTRWSNSPHSIYES